MKLTIASVLFAAAAQTTTAQLVRNGGKPLHVRERRRSRQQQPRRLQDEDSLSMSASFSPNLLVEEHPGGGSSKSGKGKETVVYFVRHAEQETTTLELGGATTAYNLQWPGSPGTGESPDITERDGDVVGKNFDMVCGNENCAEGLTLQGVTRAHLLSSWMMENGIVDELTHVFSSHKRRTALTVEPTASLAGLTVVQYPVDGEELNPEGNGPSICPTVEAIMNSPPGSVILVAGHTSTIYQIMDEGREGCEGGIGLDTSDPDFFPKEETRKRLPREYYGFVWKVKINKDGDARLDKRVTLDFAFKETVEEN